MLNYRARDHNRSSAAKPSLQQPPQGLAIIAFLEGIL